MIDLSGTNDPDTGDIYGGFDRFGRVKDNRWYDYGSSVDVDRVKYGYDRASNRIWRQNPVATALSKAFDELYANDGVQRLKDMQRGTLNGTHTALTTTTFAQCWTLDPTGNWTGFRQDDDGGGTWDLDQARTSNTVNEITNITETAGPSWATPAYNRAGNMTTMPKPAAPTGSYTATYDAWNRLVKLVDGANTVLEYEYDGVKRRIVQKSYTAGTLSETRHLYYTRPSQWQVIEERLGTSPDSADPVSQTIWGLRYIDDCLLRDRDTNGDGTLNERLYALQDANWNVTSLADTTGTIQERYAYTPYGVPSCLTPSFTPRASSNYAWNTLYCGYRYEPATGLYHVRHRALHPLLGVWLQRDIQYFDGPNLYSPYFAPDRVDPLGQWWQIAILVTAIVVAIAVIIRKLLPPEPPRVPMTGDQATTVRTMIDKLSECSRKAGNNALASNLANMIIGDVFTEEGAIAIDANARTTGKTTNFSPAFFNSSPCQQFQTIQHEASRVGGNYADENNNPEGLGKLENQETEAFRDLAACLDCCHLYPKAAAPPGCGDKVACDAQGSSSVT